MQYNKNGRSFQICSKISNTDNTPLNVLCHEKISFIDPLSMFQPRNSSFYYRPLMITLRITGVYGGKYLLDTSSQFIFTKCIYNINVIRDRASKCAYYLIVSRYG